MSMATMIAIGADPQDLDDSSMSVGWVERGLMCRRIRRLRTLLGMTMQTFAKVYGSPLVMMRKQDTGRTMPLSTMWACLKVIDAEPEVATRAVSGSRNEIVGNRSFGPSRGPRWHASIEHIDPSMFKGGELLGVC